MLPRIKKIGFRHAHINDDIYSDNDLILHAGGVELLDASHKMTKDDFEKLMLHEPEIAILGVGFKDKVRIDKSVLDAAKKQKVELYVLPTAGAAKKFHELARAGKKVVAKLHITC